MNARIRFSVAAEVLYAVTMRLGSWARDSGVKSNPLTISPRKAGSVTPSRVSSFEERGLANCPAMRPILMTGIDEP